MPAYSKDYIKQLATAADHANKAAAATRAEAEQLRRCAEHSSRKARAARIDYLRAKLGTQFFGPGVGDDLADTIFDQAHELANSDDEEAIASFYKVLATAAVTGYSKGYNAGLLDGYNNGVNDGQLLATS